MGVPENQSEATTTVSEIALPEVSSSVAPTPLSKTFSRRAQLNHVEPASLWTRVFRTPFNREQVVSGRSLSLLAVGSLLATACSDGGDGVWQDEASEAAEVAAPSHLGDPAHASESSVIPESWERNDSPGEDELPDTTHSEVEPDAVPVPNREATQEADVTRDTASADGASSAGVEVQVLSGHGGPSEFGQVTRSARIAGVPWVSQLGDCPSWARTKTCGPVAVAMAATYLLGGDLNVRIATYLSEYLKQEACGEPTNNVEWKLLAGQERIAARDVFGWTAQELVQTLQAGHPVVASIYTQDTSTSERLDIRARVPHAMLIIGITPTSIIAHDPGRTKAEDGASVEFELDHFLEAWQSASGRYGLVLGPVLPEPTVSTPSCDEGSTCGAPPSVTTETEEPAFVLEANHSTNFTSTGPCDTLRSRALYVGRATELDAENNSVTLEFAKCDASPPSQPVHYWVVVGERWPSESSLSNYVARAEGTWWAGTRLRVTTDAWPNAAALAESSCSSTKHLFLITSGSDTSGRRWYSFEAVGVTKHCAGE